MSKTFHCSARNRNGETYGVDALADFVGYVPDLQGAVGTNGVSGYVPDLQGAIGTNSEHGYIRRSEVPGPRMFEEYKTDVGKAYQLYNEWAKANPAPWTVNLYDSEGNVIGEFEISQGVTSEEIFSGFDTAGMSIEEVKNLVASVTDG